MQYGGVQLIGLPQLVIHFHRKFHDKPSGYWGTLMTKETSSTVVDVGSASRNRLQGDHVTTQLGIFFMDVPTHTHFSHTSTIAILST